MKKLSLVVLSLLMSATVILSGIDDAEARRLGGGRSFGSRPSYSMPYQQRGGNTAVAPTNPSAGQYNSAAQQNQAMRDNFSRRGGFMGMLGSLALGGLLGAMLFGGAFEHIGFLDIVLIGGLAFLLLRPFLARRRAMMEQMAARPGYAGAASVPEHELDNPGYQRTAGPEVIPAEQPRSYEQPANAPAHTVAEDYSPPSGFDKAAFLNEAKQLYTKLQDYWDKGELAELRGLTTDKVFGELQDQIRERKGENKTELLKIDAELLDIHQVGFDYEASVLFDVSMKEAADSQPQQVQEVWHFVRTKFGTSTNWLLDGIQQMEDK